MQAAGHMREPSQESHMDGSMNAPMAHHMAYQQHQQAQHQAQELHRHPLPVEQFPGNASFAEGDTSMMDREDNIEGDSVNNELGPPRSGSLRSSANNELEMRQLFSANRHRGLQDVAGELHGNERGPNSERTRQVFAMLWYGQPCPSLHRPSANLYQDQLGLLDRQRVRTARTSLCELCEPMRHREDYCSEPCQLR